MQAQRPAASPASFDPVLLFRALGALGLSAYEAAVADMLFETAAVTALDAAVLLKRAQMPALDIMRVRAHLFPVGRGMLGVRDARAK